MGIRFIGTNFQMYSGEAFLLGIILDMFLFGTLVSQVYTYYIGFPKDKTTIRLGVMTILGIGTTQSILGVLDFYNFATGTYVRKHMDGMRTSTLEFSSISDHIWFSVTISSAAVAMIVQFIHAQKVHVLIQRPRVTILILGLSLAQMACALTNSLFPFVNSENESTHFTIPTKNLALTVAWVLISLSCDITISVYLISFLRKGRQEVMKESTRSRITQLIRVLLETGIATFIAILCYGFVYAFLSDSIVLPGLSMGKIYGNSMLAILNSRITIVGGRSSEAHRKWEVEELRTKVL